MLFLIVKANVIKIHSLKLQNQEKKNFPSQKMKKWEKGRKIYHSNKNLKRKKKRLESKSDPNHPNGCSTNMIM